MEWDLPAPPLTFSRLYRVPSIPLQILHSGFRARVNVEFIVDRPQMIAQGIDADSKISGDFLVKITFGKKREDFLLSRRQFFHVR